jgi:glycogen debranching enzyme
MPRGGLEADMSALITDTGRPTPADPIPGITKDRSIPSSEARNMPPELGTDAVAILEGRTFMYSDGVGDVAAGSIGGLVHADTRFLNRWTLSVNGAPLLALRAGPVDYYSAQFFLTNGQLPGLRPNSVAVRRMRFVGGGLNERIEVQNFAREPVHIELRLGVGNDFADLFEIKDHARDRSSEIQREEAADGSSLAFHYRHEGFQADTVVIASTPASRIEGNDFVWDLDLDLDEQWTCEMHVPLKLGKNEIQPRHSGYGEVFSPSGDDSVKRWQAQMPKFDTDSHLLGSIIRRTGEDLVALRIEAKRDDLEVVLPAAGLPWFLTLFGRDTLITAYQTVAFGPRLARGALLALALFQGKEVKDFNDEEPGKMLHEIRVGELTQLHVKPHDPYYGTADATQLWLILLSEYWRWTGDDELVRSLRDNVHRALEWIDRYGDIDGDGYVEYKTRSPQGLGNQCWRDSWDGVQFADGKLPTLPIATAEIQGYGYDAKLRVAELAEGPLAEPELAARLRREAEELRTRFNEDFWIEDRGYYAIGLDADKRQIDSLTSNIGQLLWTGIVPDDRAAAIAPILLSDALYSGWGVRTLSTRDNGFNPIGYHTGTVWPHDNSIIAMGLARYGFRDEANRVSMGLLEAAAFSGYRLPEAFSGYPRSMGRFPVPYPTACSPQAWATGAPLLFVRAMLGLDARDGAIRLDPNVPDEIGRIAIRGLSAFGSRWDIEAIGTKGNVRLSRMGD